MTRIVEPNTQLDGDLQVEDLRVKGDLTVDGAFIPGSGDVDITGDLQISGDLDVDDDVNIDGDIVVDLTSTLTGLVTATAGITTPATILATGTAAGATNILKRDPARLLAAHQGLVAESGTRAHYPAGILIVTQTVYLAAIPVLKGDILTGLAVLVTVEDDAASTLVKCGIYTGVATTPVRLAVSADVDTTWESKGTKKTDFGTPYEVLADGVIYGAILQVSGGTMATLLGRASLADSGPLVTGGLRVVGSEAAQSDLDANITIADSAVGVWMGLY